MTTFQEKVKALRAHHEELLSRKNEPVECEATWLPFGRR